MICESLIRSAEAMGLAMDEDTARKFDTYHSMLAEANKRMNLTRVVDDEQEAIDRHYLDSISPFAVSGLMDGVGTLCDIGTGAGFPGVPIAIYCPDIRVTLVDALAKRVGFLQEVIDALHLNAVAVHARAEDAARQSNLRESFDMSTARAVAALDVLCEYTLPFARTGGRMLAYKGPSLEEELPRAKAAIQLLGGKTQAVHSVHIPGRDWDHRLLTVQKIAPTPNKYPRKAGEPTKKPLGGKA